MKKLVTAFAACALASLAPAQVESVNIVGYQTMALNQGAYTHVTPTFITIGGVQSVPLSSLVGDFVELDSIQFIDSRPATAREYFWLEEGSASPGVSGWYADDFEVPAGNVLIDAGISVYYSSQGATEITFTGEVGTENVTVIAGSGFTAVGNPFPVDSSLDAISFSGITELSSIQILDSNTSTLTEYFWLEEGSTSPGDTGWFLDDFETPAGATTIAAGEGFLVNTDSSSVTVTFTSPVAL